MNRKRNSNKMTSLIVIFILAVSNISSGDNILFYFPGVNFSQMNSVWPLVTVLASNGHNVTFLSPQVKSPSTLQNVTTISPKILQQLVSPLYKIDRFADREAGKEKLFDYVGATVMLCENVLNESYSDPSLSKLFSSDTTFELVIVNSLLSECGFFVAKYFKAKTIQYSPCTVDPFVNEAYGVLTEAAWIPDLVYKFENIPMSFLDRAYNAFLPVYWQWMRSYQISPALENCAKKHLQLDRVPSLYELENEVSLVLLNSHVAADFARTLPPLFVDVGGMATWEKEKKIPQQFLDFINGPKNKSDEPVVLITFGSTVLLNGVKKRYQAMFFQMIDNFPNVKFIMRWKGPLPEFLGGVPKNLMISEWLPQRELLSHPSVKAFLTHGGISSVHEATYYGVPIIALPLFSDQDYNAYRVEAQEVGLRVEIRGMTSNTLINAVKRVLTEKRFGENMMKKKEIFRDRPQSPVETALFWTEFALRHNDTISTFRPANQHLNFIQIRLLDVYIFCFVCVSLLFLITIKVIAFISLKIMGSPKWGKSSEIEKSKKQN